VQFYDVAVIKQMVPANHLTVVPILPLRPSNQIRQFRFRVLSAQSRRVDQLHFDILLTGIMPGVGVQVVNGYSDTFGAAWVSDAGKVEVDAAAEENDCF
jgi:hypothetical protein